MILCAGVWNKGNTTLYRNVNKMIGVVLTPTQAKWVVPKTGILDHSAILPVCFVFNCMDDGWRYCVQVFKIKETLLCVEMSIKLEDWDSNPRHWGDWCLKPVPYTTRQYCLYILWSFAWMMVEHVMCRCSKIKETRLCIVMSTKWQD